MIWATVSSLFCFCWLFRTSPSSAAVNIVNLISVFTIRWCSSVESSLVLLEEGVCYDQCILFAKLCYLWPVLFCTPRPNLPVTPGYLFLLLHSSSLWRKGHLFGVLVLEGLLGLHRTIQLQLFSISGWNIDLDYCYIEWFALEMNRGHSVIFEIAFKFCILDSFVYYDGYSISSKGFLSIVVDIMVIWVKLIHSSPFQLADSLNVDVHSCHLLFEHFQFALIHGPNLPGYYAGV